MALIAAAVSEIPPFLPQLVALVVASALIAYICQRLRILPIVGFLVTGVLIGPNALGVVRDSELIDTVAEIGVVLLLFTLGIEFSFERMSRIKRTIFLGGSLQIVFAIAETVGILMMVGVEWRTGIFSGALVALSSTAIVLKLLADQAEMSSAKGQLAVGILIFQDLAIVAMVLLLPILASETTSAWPILRGLATAILVVTAVVLMARRLMPPLLERVARTCSPEIFLLTVVAICLGSAWLTSLVGVSLSLGAFLAGLVVSESRFSHHAFAEILPLQILFSAVFFVSVGLLLDLGFVISHLPLILTAVAAILVLKIITTSASAILLGYPLPVAVATSLLIAQIGEFSFVLERVGRTAGLHPAGVRGMEGQTFIAAAVLLMILTPVLSQVSRVFEKHLAATPLPPEEEAEEKRVAMEHHVIVAGYGSAARYLTRVMRDSGIPFVILTLSPTGATEAEHENLPVILGDYSRRHLLDLAGIDRAKVLVIPDDAPEMARRVTAIARNLNPTLQIVVRTRSNSDVDDLIASGADHVLVEELEVAVQLFTRVLTEYRVSLDEIDDHVTTVRAGGYAALRTGLEDIPLVVCEDLDQECFDTRTFRLQPGTKALGQTATEFAAATGIAVTAVERNGNVIDDLSGVVLAAGDQVTARGSASGFAGAAPALRGDRPNVPTAPPRVVSMSEEQRKGCQHAATVNAEMTSSATGCEDCLRLGDSWVELRICMSCGGVRCCDSSKNRHATRHYESSQHPIIKSYQPAELWAWCYPDRLTL